MHNEAALSATVGFDNVTSNPISTIHFGAMAQWLFAGLVLCATLGWPVAAAEAPDLVQPRQLIVDSSLPKAQAEAQILAARRYDTFWSTGDAMLAQSALAPDFMDRTLPPGRVQGIAGPLDASKTVRNAIPDLKCAIEQMLVAGDRVVGHLHFTGRFAETQGNGEAIDFIATDIYKITDGQIAENWHIEDNLTLLRQLHQIADR